VFQWGDDINGLNRHAVLHGADTNYATRERSLQALLWLDLVVTLLGWISSDDDPHYHVPGCAKLSEPSSPVHYAARVCPAGLPLP